MLAAITMSLATRAVWPMLVSVVARHGDEVAISSRRYREGVVESPQDTESVHTAVHEVTIIDAVRFRTAFGMKLVGKTA